MTGRIFVFSDPHFGHDSTWKKFKREDGSPLRPFTSTEEMNETMIRNWNNVVTPEDHVYVLGDVVMREEFLLPVCSRLMGKKRLVRGNHDLCKTKKYIEAGFKEIYGIRIFREDDTSGMPNCALTHVPIHPDCMGRWGINVHGHLHANVVTKKTGRKIPCGFTEAEIAAEPYVELIFEDERVPDRRYVNVAVEQINYTPVLLDEIVKERGCPDA